MTSQIIDITDKICPMTTVYVRLSFDRAAPGTDIHILLKGEETRRNVMRLLETLGQIPQCSAPRDTTIADYRISFVKS
ncbi:sulfurtransferase TusA family protein [Asaia krungthepensis]|uniref:sulfurtransferase TusA family protein n=1 Tax=Asaia krungthepensis TaxID=220990 RepID=UPI00223212C0|nr:sulfurtransferase TusA family protein [Asaia krungthepensis]